MGEGVTISPEAARFLLDLLNQQQISARDPNLLETAATVARVLAELSGDRISTE